MVLLLVRFLGEHDWGGCAARWPTRLKALFAALRDNVRIVFLNACFSHIQGEAIREVIDCVVGMNSEVGDAAAVTFAASFYRALAFGRSVAEAFEQGKVAMMLEGIPEENVPVLLSRAGTNPATIFLIPTTTPSALAAVDDITPSTEQTVPLTASGIPALFSAVEFLFGEGSRILQERRERRQAGQGLTIGQSTNAVLSPENGAASSYLIQSKEAALTQPVSQATWLAMEARIDHLLTLLAIHCKNYHLAKEQYAKWGSALVPPIIVNNLSEAESAIARTTEELQAALSRVMERELRLQR